jgi:enamine deaminase RidA (YjgF/YER057c/UK114 family)
MGTADGSSARPDPHRRLAELGLSLPSVAAPAGSYVPAVRSGALVYTSGQLPLVDGRLAVTGKVGAGTDAAVTAAQANDLARTCALNALAAIDALVGLEHVVRVVRVGGFVASDPDFTAQPGVINGASDLLAEVFGAAGQHARAAVGVAVLPLDSPVEVDLIVEVDAVADSSAEVADTSPGAEVG